MMTKDQICGEFQISEDRLEGVEILMASYTYEDYSGEALVVVKKDGKLFEVNASHCSCMGLEGQWEPEETTIEALRQREPYSKTVAEDLKTFLTQYTGGKIWQIGYWKMRNGCIARVLCTDAPGEYPLIGYELVNFGFGPDCNLHSWRADGSFWEDTHPSQTDLIEFIGEKL